jgi:hypothetical protein
MITFRPVEIDDLPRRRRLALLWRHALEYDDLDDLIHGLNQRIVDASGRACDLQWGEAVASTGSTWSAVLGDDQRYHLAIDGTPRCLHPYKGNRRRVETLLHKARDRGSVPTGAVNVKPTPRKTYTWEVTLTATAVDPSTVAHRNRCLTSASRPHWPPHVDLTTIAGRQRHQLLTTYGPACHACGRRVATQTDHDHFTGVIRGMLCNFCNTMIDRCLHLTGCRWADYLNNPPATPLQMIYTKWDGPQKRTVADRIKRLGYNPLYRPDRNSTEDPYSTDDPENAPPQPNRALRPSGQRTTRRAQ